MGSVGSVKMTGLIEAIFARKFPGVARQLTSGDPADMPMWDEVKAMRAEWLRKSKDPVTGLLSRSTWFELLHYHVRKSVPKLPSEKEGIGMITPDVLEALLREIIVGVGDVAGLSLANKQGLRNGDDLLRRIAGKTDLVGGEDFFFGRYGGDEIVGAAVGRTFEQVVADVSIWRVAVRGMVVHSLRGLSPEINVGLASLSEALQYVLEYRPSEMGRTPYRDLEDILFSIANHRMAYEKCLERLELLANLWKESREKYWAFAGYLTKAAHDPTDRDIAWFASITNDVEFRRESSRWASKGVDSNPVMAFALRHVRGLLES